MRRRGCIWGLIGFLGLLLVVYNRQGQAPVQDRVPTLMALPTDAPVTVGESSVEGSPTATVTDTALPTNTLPPTITIEPSPTITDTPTLIPTAVPVQPTAASVQAQVLGMQESTFYTTSGVNLRSCPNTSCEPMGQVNEGTALTANGRIEGEEVNAGNAVWYRIVYGGDEAYVYGGLVTANAPVQQQQQTPVQQQQTPVQQQQAFYPRTCATAVAAGYGAADIAQQWPHLDRNKNGVACYGS